MYDQPIGNLAPPANQPIMNQPVAGPPPGQMVVAAQVINQAPNVNVVLAQQLKRPWTSGLFGCFEDVPSCLMVWCCPPCMECYVSSEMGESCCVPMCVPGSLVALRTKMRAEQHIEGSIMKDCFVSCCCWACSLCQLKRENDLIKRIRAGQMMNLVNQM